MAKSIPQPCSVLSISMDMGLQEEVYSTPKVCYSSPSLRSDGSVLSISKLKTPFATNMFALQGGPVFPVALLLYELWLLEGSK